MPEILGRIKKLLTILRAGSLRSQLRRHRVAAGVEHMPVLETLEGCRVVLDVGANRGQFSLAVRRCFPDARIVAFEPLSAPAETFARVFTGDQRVTMHRVAIGPRAGSAVIHVSARDDSSSMLPIGAAQSSLFPGTAEIGTESIAIGRLRDYVSAADIEAPALLKLDVQGFELSALEGCEELLQRFSWIYVESSFVELYEGQALADTVIAWLQQRGFALAGVYHMSYDRAGRAIQADFLFRRC